MYEDVLDKINQKLALKEAMERANRAIEASKKPSRMDADDYDSRSLVSKASAVSKRSG